MQISHYANHRLLGAILSIFPLPQHTHTKAENRTLEAIDKVNLRRGLSG